MNRGRAFPGSGIANMPPLMRPISDQFIGAGNAMEVFIEAIDPDTNTMTLTLGGAPIEATLFDNGDGTGRIAYTGQVADAGTDFNVEVYADDGTGVTTGRFTLTVIAAQYDGLISNEYMADPNYRDDHVDSNMDGNEDAYEDEFVEIVNNTTSLVDIVNCTIENVGGGGGVRHTFPSTILEAGEAVVVFGGGDLGNFTYAQAQLASSGELALRNSDDIITLRSPGGGIIDQVSHELQIQAQSYTRYPDLKGGCTQQHYVVTAFARRASPGRKTDYSYFLTNQPPRLGAVDDLSASVGIPMSFTISALEPDGETVTMTASNLPANSTFTPTNGTGSAKGGFAFTPSPWQNNQTFTVYVYASDSNGADTQAVNITVSTSEYDYFWDFEDQTFQGWTAHSQASDDDWYVGSYNENYFAAMNGYGADVASKDWLVSPALDLASMDNPVLSFLSAKNYDDLGTHEFVCRVSTNYDGSGDPWTSGDWTDLSATLSEGGWSWTNSGDISLSAYKQTNTYLCFYYECSGTGSDQAEAWEVDDIGIADESPNDPVITITNPVDEVTVTSGTTTYDLRGSASTSVVGSILWSNIQQGIGGTIPAEERWAVTGIGLGYGENVIVVYGTNNSGDADSDAVIISRPYSAAGETNTLIISEVADPSNAWTSRFVEIYNAGTGTINLADNDWTLARQANGTYWADIPLSGSIAPSATHVVAYNALTFQSDYGKNADQVSTNITGNGDDGYFLYKYGDHTIGALIDAYGVIDEDGTTQAWEYVDGRAVRKGGITEPNATWTAGEWAITNASTALMTPCVHPDSLVSNQPPILDAIGNQSVTESNLLQFAVSASDPFDGDTITLTVSNVPGGAEFGSTNDNGLFSWPVPTAGTYNVTFWATDKDGFDSEEITITVGSLAGSQMLISEVADPQDDYTARFVELYNAGSVAINLGADDWYLSKQTGDSGNWSDASLSGTVDPGDTFVIANDSESFNSAYGQMPDDDNSLVVNGNGDDVYALYKGGDHSAGTLIDMYGVIDQDGTGQDWEYTDGRAYRKAAVTSPNDTWTSSEWMIYMSTGTVSVMTPGVHPDGTASNEPPVLASIGNRSVTHSNTLNFVINASDPVDGDPITLTASNLPAGAVFSPTNENGSVRWINAGPVGVYTCQFYATDKDGFDSEEITITVNASGGGDTPLDISGYELKQYDASKTYTIPADTEVNPGGYVIIARNADKAAFETFWSTSLAANVVFLNSGDVCPQINGAETYELTDGASTVDGPSGLAMTTGNTVERNNTTDDGTAAGSWSAGSASSATPGSGANGNQTAGLVINEYSDAGTYDYEFVELYYDSAGGGGPAGLDAPVIAAATDVAGESFKANWSSVSNATGYLLNVATNDSFSSGGSTTSTLVDADFQTDWDGFFQEDLAGAQSWDRDDAGQSGLYYAMMNGWSGGAVSNEDWLISPALDLDSYTGEVLTFKTARGTYADIDLDLFVSTNYSGSGNPYAATWTPLAATFADYSGSAWTWTDSGNIDLSGVAGSSVYVGFRYGSTSSSSEKWEVDDVLITGKSGGGASHYVPGYEARHAGANYLTVTGLTEGVTYYRVRSTNDSDTSDYSGTTNVTTTAAANTPPILQPVGNFSVEINDSLMFNVTATDADNDEISHFMTDAPAGATLTAVTNAGGVTNTFNWSAASPTGLYAVTFFATDIQTQDWEQITIEVYGLDRDGDGIPNDYENRYGLGSTVSNSSDDADSDGYLNIDEYIADTIPTNDQSFFCNMITNYNALMLTGDTVRIMIGPPTTNSRVYDVWSATNLMPPVIWTPHNLDIPGALGGGPVWVTVTNNPEVRFYRTGVKAP